MLNRVEHEKSFIISRPGRPDRFLNSVKLSLNWHTSAVILNVLHSILRMRSSWGGGAGNLEVIVVQVCEPVFQNLPHSYT